MVLSVDVYRWICGWRIDVESFQGRCLSQLGWFVTFYYDLSMLK